MISLWPYPGQSVLNHLGGVVPTSGISGITDELYAAYYSLLVAQGALYTWDPLGGSSAPVVLGTTFDIFQQSPAHGGVKRLYTIEPNTWLGRNRTALMTIEVMFRGDGIASGTEIGRAPVTGSLVARIQIDSDAAGALSLPLDANDTWDIETQPSPAYVPGITIEIKEGGELAIVGLGNGPNAVWGLRMRGQMIERAIAPGEDSGDA